MASLSGFTPNETRGFAPRGSGVATLSLTPPSILCDSYVSSSGQLALPTRFVSLRASAWPTGHRPAGSVGRRTSAPLAESARRDTRGTHEEHGNIVFAVILR